MCLWGQCICVCGCKRRLRTIRTPPGYVEPPTRLQCLACGEIGPAVYVTEEDRCHICFIPCCCAQMVSDPLLACSNCHIRFGSTPVKCNSCGVHMAVRSGYCANCGAARTQRNSTTWSHRPSDAGGDKDTQGSPPKNKPDETEEQSPQHGDGDLHGRIGDTKKKE